MVLIGESLVLFFQGLFAKLSIFCWDSFNLNPQSLNSTCLLVFNMASSGRNNGFLGEHAKTCPQNISGSTPMDKINIYIFIVKLISYKLCCILRMDILPISFIHLI